MRDAATGRKIIVDPIVAGQDQGATWRAFPIDNQTMLLYY
jgi:hypothetical protein